MERCSYFIQDKALFGSFPTQEAVDSLEKNGVRCFIDLTGSDEHKITPYKTKYKYIKYPIIDRKIPYNWKSFAQLIVEICRDIRCLSTGEKVYIHCKGGHGRSGILVACILCHYYNITPDEALKQTAKYHSNRPEMKEKWRKLGSPQGKRQKDFVYKFFKVLRYSHSETIGFTSWLNNTSSHPVTIPNLGTFPTAHFAFQAFRTHTGPEYIKKLQQGVFCPELVIYNKCWEENKMEYMYKILDLKFRQHTELKVGLMNTGLRPLMKISYDGYWGDGYNGLGRNIHGRLLSKIRNQLLYEDFRISVTEES